MTDRVLIIGGRGRIGSQVAADIATHTQATITITGRSQTAELANPSLQYLSLDLENTASLKAAIQSSCDTGHTIVVHCAGPFQCRGTDVLDACIAAGADYVDVSDHPSFTRQLRERREAAIAAGITAITNTGIFPGISNSMVRRDVEQLEKPEKIHLSYVVGGSGGAGITVMRTTFLGLRQPFQAWIDKRWQTVMPYSGREKVLFPPPYGPIGVYWFEMPETFTLPETFPVTSVITKFGSAPDFYNHLTWSVAHWWPDWMLKQPAVIEFLAQVSYAMTRFTDRLSGIGVAIRSQVTGYQNGQPTVVESTLIHPNTAISVGYGTGSVVQLLLSGALHQPGVWVVEEALPTQLFEQTMAQRGIQIEQNIYSYSE